MSKYIKITILLAFLFGGCANSNQPKLHNNLGDAISKSYMITIGMSKNEVMNILKIKPSIIQRLNENELWIYENEQPNSSTVENDFYTLMLKFKKGLLVSIGAYSCKVPNLDKQ